MPRGSRWTGTPTNHRQIKYYTRNRKMVDVTEWNGREITTWNQFANYIVSLNIMPENSTHSDRSEYFDMFWKAYCLGVKHGKE